MEANQSELGKLKSNILAIVRVSISYSFGGDLSIKSESA